MSNSEEFIGQLVAKYGKKRDSLMPILQDVVDNFYYLNEERMVTIAKALDISTADVYGTASFYSFLNTNERGKYAIRVCQTIICDMKRKEDIIDAITELIGIKPHNTCAWKCAVQLVNERFCANTTHHDIRYFAVGAG